MTLLRGEKTCKVRTGDGGRSLRERNSLKYHSDYGEITEGKGHINLPGELTIPRYPGKLKSAAGLESRPTGNPTEGEPIVR